ncbi:MAG: hypothetical protein IE926_12330 [Micrococcales bacterium]|nr:hypothetical protein [Micrococcales bacterium]
MTPSRFDNPPTQWAALGDMPIIAIDEAAGIYLGPSFRPETTNPTFWHWCTGLAVEPRYLAMGTPHHTVESRDPWHLEPSLLCPECGCHGWIRDGRWASA